MPQISDWEDGDKPNISINKKLGMTLTFENTCCVLETQKGKYAIEHKEEGVGSSHCYSVYEGQAGDRFVYIYATDTGIVLMNY